MILNHSEESLDQNAKMEDALVPIRLDMEIEGSFIQLMYLHDFPS